MKKIKRTYSKFEKMLNDELEERKKRHCSPLFKQKEDEFMTLSNANVFYGYRTTLKMDNDIKNSLLTVKNNQKAR